MQENTVEKEIKTQERVIKFFKDELGYEYIGDLQGLDNKNIREDELRSRLQGRGYSDILIDKALKKLEDEKTVIVIKAKSGADGRLFGTIPSKQIAEELKKQYNLSIDKRKIQLEQNLASLGYHHVAAKLHHDVTAKLNVHVVEA